MAVLAMPGRKSADRGRFVSGHHVRLLWGGKAFFDLLIRLIERARECIHLQVYIYESDATGTLVADALIAAAERGVAVYVLVDGYGSQRLPKAFVTRLRKGGVHFRVFEPLLRSRHFYFGRRLHRKVLVVDARYAVITGVNIGNKYNDLPGQAAWLDAAVCIAGEVAASLCNACWTTWKNFRFTRRLPKGCQPATTDIDFGQTHRCAARMRRNDWVRRKYEISRTYREIFQDAEEEITLLSSYFLPGRSVQKDIEAAAKRGVRIRVIICSRMDVPFVKNAERYMYDWLLHHGVEIYEYRGSMLHGKLATCDREWMTVGSFNVNDLSARVSIELNIDLQSKGMVQQAITEMEKIIADDCERIMRENVKLKSTAWARLVRWWAFRTLRVLFFLGTFYMRQEKPV
ncbi:phospholipase D-like domain-containing protein [Parapedobacter sp. 10938]|uniref:phospholipase D-like domain-containing protein n=1 Tax=Parapedobacter flavus TaxID=3110225 RepID=UPI002DBE8816|nr:phospholipase D-like domain-containing protein [Parapedobacter sp. 10938]MEC3881673.1 phospholipase D-like domain-containing protein [Parapedobacter sp. 10938]